MTLLASILLRSSPARALGVLAGTLALLTGCGAGGEPVPRHVLLISIDTLRADHLACYGYERPTSPHLDALAARGVVFEDVTASSPWTLPSHASLLTGLYPSRAGMRAPEHRLAEPIPTLAEHLTARGFTTRAVVNSYFLSKRSGLDAGFETYDYVEEFLSNGNIVNRAPAITDRALQLLDDPDLGDAGSERIFLFLHYYDVHSDYAPEEPWRSRMVRPYAGRLDGTTPQLTGLRSARQKLAPGDLRHLIDLYDAEILQLDAELGRLFAGLEARGLAEDTLIVVTSDHGEEFQEHGWILHGHDFWQELVGIPLIVAGPGLPAGLRSDTPASLIDVAPTVARLVERPLADEHDGIDLSPAWRGGVLPRERVLFSEALHVPENPGKKWMVRRGPMKLVLNYVNRRKRLFDLGADPAELTSLAAERSETTSELLELLRAQIRLRPIAEDFAETPGTTDVENLRKIGY